MRSGGLSGRRELGYAVWMGWEWRGRRGKLTVRIELEDMKITVRVGDDDEQLFAVREEIGGDCFDVLEGFAELAELVGFFLYAV